MISKKNKSRSPVPASELRQDPITGKWIVLATSRAKRPRDVVRLLPPRTRVPRYTPHCPFCNMKEHPQAPSTLVLPEENDAWRVRAFPNKYPAFLPNPHPRRAHVGPYTWMEAAGAHEVIITKDHNATLASASPEDAVAYVQAWQKRYEVLMTDPTIAYIQIIENHGNAAGASLEHTHAQIFGVPVIPNDEILDLLVGAEAYFTQHTHCAYCDILSFEIKKKDRIIYENNAFVVFAPYTSRVAFEQWILPKAHASGFHELLAGDLPALADALHNATKSLATAFHDPAYNLYVYSAPCDADGFLCGTEQFSHFHWHIQILPRFGVWGGFELATGMEITSAIPEESAAFLREHIQDKQGKV